MITEALVGVGTWFGGWIVGLFPEWNPPAWLYEVPAMFSTAFGMVSGLGVWFDWQALGVVVGSVVAAYVIGFLVRLTRAVIAHIPQFGGGG